VIVSVTDWVPFVSFADVTLHDPVVSVTHDPAAGLPELHEPATVALLINAPLASFTVIVTVARQPDLPFGAEVPASDATCMTTGGGGC
jgi:hypothetical protein